MGCLRSVNLKFVTGFCRNVSLTNLLRLGMRPDTLKVSRTHTDSSGGLWKTSRWCLAITQQFSQAVTLVSSSLMLFTTLLVTLVKRSAPTCHKSRQTNSFQMQHAAQCKDCRIQFQPITDGLIIINVLERSCLKWDPRHQALFVLLRDNLIMCES